MQLTPGTRIEFTRDGRTIRGTITSIGFRQIEAQPDGESAWVYVQPGRFTVLNEADELYRTRLLQRARAALEFVTNQGIEEFLDKCGVALPKKE